MKHLTTAEVRKLVGHLLLPYEVEDRERYLPTKDQLKVVITFLRASEKCKGVKTIEKGIPKRALCIMREFSELHPETLEWTRRNLQEFERICKRIVWHGPIV